MPYKHRLETLAILSLSLILTSSLSLSGVLPVLLAHFSNYSRVSVEFLISAPAISMTLIIAFSPFIACYLKERLTITLGLLIAGISGILPFFMPTYGGILLTRLLLGVGVGLINTRAISMIGERFTGPKRVKLLGYRLSAETLGQTALTLVAGSLAAFGWQAPFLIYGLSFLILVVYLAFVPAQIVPPAATVANQAQPLAKMSLKQWLPVLRSALLIGFLITTNVGNALRIPSYIVENNLGSPLSANKVLTLSVFAGFIAGLVFG